jgi:hypothetical protein
VNDQLRRHLLDVDDRIKVRHGWWDPIMLEDLLIKSPPQTLASAMG